jgi:hypothetical protein
MADSLFARSGLFLSGIVPKGGVPMPRPKRKTASPTFMVQGRPIADKDAKRLGEIVGKPIEGLFLLDVESAIGIATEGEPHLDHIPSSADYVREFQPVQKLALRLLKTVIGWSGYYRDAFILHKADVHAIEQAIAELERVARAVVALNKDKPSKGARKSGALTKSVLTLSDLFQRQYTGAEKGKKGKEIEFIRVALVAGRAIPANYTGISAILRRAEENK